ncbi:MAG TPA: FxsA family protein [Baekduia sp.]|uniref:FxsA family protein n=1 Tax=Baekduia sp. TaxID=2600305 RepID=UPI002C51BAD1|nr:FxsA family protein [Baekduia sp.]HMJ35283.1 FxsA family protein [Baekduia sp.]
MPFLLLLVLFVLVPILEIYVIIQVGQAIGAWWTIALLIADSIAGSVLMRSQGRAAWRRFQAALTEGRVPGREVLDGVLIIFGGAFLLTPGFCSDIVGALLLIPPTRAVIRRIIVRRFSFQVLADMPSPGIPGGGRRRRRGPGSPGTPGAPGPGDAYDVDGTATEIDPRRLP